MILIRDLIKQAAYNAGFRGSHLEAAVDIANCESQFNTNAHCLNCVPGVKEDSRGLWQINVNAHPQYKNVNLFDAQVNANAAFQVYKEANNTFKPWTCAKKLGLVNPDPEKNNYFFAIALVLGFVIYSSKKI